MIETRVTINHIRMDDGTVLHDVEVATTGDDDDITAGQVLSMLRTAEHEILHNGI